MSDEEFDKMLKKQVQEDKYIPEKINQLFSNFESEVNMKENKKKYNKLKIGNYFGKASIAACSILAVFFGGCTYAHVNGTETIISPLLRNLGINSRYEENATSFDNEVTADNVKIKMLDGAIDDTTFIVGYEIDIPNIDSDSWIEIEGNYKINGMNFTPVNTSMDKTSDTTFVYYQIYDVNEIKINTTQDVKVNASIYRIKEYTECEDIDSAYAIYGKTFENDWNLEENINVKSLEDSKTYEFENPQNYEITKNIKVSVTEFVTGSYANILKIKTDKTNYDGDSIEKYYKVLDENNKEIITCNEEEKQYEEVIYNDRIVTEKINKNSKLKIEVYSRIYGKGNFIKTATIPVDLKNAIEKKEEKINWKQYKTEDYSFKYKENWTLTPKVDTTKVGPNSSYLGALQLEIPSTTNSEYTSSIYVKSITTNISVDEYIKQIKKQNANENIEEKSTSEIRTKNQKGYQITSEFTDGETIDVIQQIFVSVKDKIYFITFWGSEKEYNNLKVEINEFIKNFETN